MTEQWQELKETITEMRDSNGTCTQQEVCKFLVNYMEILEKQMQEPETGRWKRIGYDIYECSICGQDVMTGDICAYRHCHCCGTRMVSPQESEEKDAP